MNLHLFDTSEYIYSGSRNLWILRGCMQTPLGFIDASLPCGSLAYVLNTFFEWQEDDDVLVYCLDSPPKYKRELHEKYFEGGYKGNRQPPPKEIIVQKAMVKEMLNMLQANTVCVEGYEADDIIASMVKYYKDDFDKIYIHAKDSDLFYLVEKTVEIMPLDNPKSGQIKKFSRNGKHIYLENWREEVKKGILCPWNVLTLFKILDGEKSDNIPAVSSVQGNIIVSNLPRSEYPKCGNNVLLRNYIKDVTNADPRTMAIVDLIQPVILPFEDVEIYETEINTTMLMNFAALCKCKYAHNWEYTKSLECEIFVNKYLNMYIED